MGHTPPLKYIVPLKNLWNRKLDAMREDSQSEAGLGTVPKRKGLEPLNRLIPPSLPP